MTILDGAYRPGGPDVPGSLDGGSTECPVPRSRTEQEPHPESPGSGIDLHTPERLPRPPRPRGSHRPARLSSASEGVAAPTEIAGSPPRSVPGTAPAIRHSRTQRSGRRVPAPGACALRYPLCPSQFGLLVAPPSGAPSLVRWAQRHRLRPRRTPFGGRLPGAAPTRRSTGPGDATRPGRWWHIRAPSGSLR